MKRFLASLFCVVCFMPSLRAQVLDSFNPGADNVVNALAIQADGKIVIGGAFNLLGGQPRAQIGRLNVDGSLDDSFHPGTNGAINCLVVETNGQILVGGYFTNLAGQARNRIGRFNADGTLDMTFNPGASGPVFSIAVQKDGNILVSGSFTNLAGQECDRIGRLTPSGALDAGFHASADDTIETMSIQPDGKIVVAGDAGSINGESRSRVDRLNVDGSVDGGVNPDANNTVYCLALQADNRVLMGGAFTTLGGLPLPFAGRLAANGLLETNFFPMAGGTGGIQPAIYSLALQADGKILMSGSITFQPLGNIRYLLARFNTNGTLDTSFDAGPVQGSFPVIYATAVQADGKIIVAGNFTSLNGTTRNYIARLIPSEIARQDLAFDGSTITWLRGGSSPEAWRTTFEASTDGLNWTALGDGARIDGGWQLGGVSIASGATIRARGFITGAEYNGSGWFVESQWPKVQPSILTGDGSLGFRSSQFGFDLSGSAGSSVIIEQSPDLQQWSPLATNMLNVGGIYFRDQNSSPGIPQRFYRAQLQ